MFLCLFSYRSTQLLVELVRNPQIRTVFRNIMKVIASDDSGTGHFLRDDFAGQNTSSNRDIACKRALLVYCDIYFQHLCS